MTEAIVKLAEIKTRRERVTRNLAVFGKVGNENGAALCREALAILEKQEKKAMEREKVKRA